MDDLKKSKREFVEEIRSLRLRLEELERDKSIFKQLKDPIGESEEKFRRLCEGTPLPYHSLDENGCLIYVNLA